MLASRSLFLPPIVGFSLVAVALAACEPSSNTKAAASPPPPPVTVAPPLIQRITEWDEYTGRFEAVERVEVRSRVSGYLESIHFRDGEIVDKGQLLFVIDPRPFQAALERAKADLQRASTRFELTKTELARAERLLATSNISQEAYDTRRQNMRDAEAQVAAARAQVRSAELDLEFTQIKSPIRGRISDRKVDVGNVVSGGTLQSTLLTTIVALDPIYFVFDVSEADYLRYLRLSRAGTRPDSRNGDDEVYVKLADETEWSRRGRLNFVDNALNPGSGTIRLRAVFDNPDLFLVPGVFGRLRVAGSGEYAAMLVPDAAVVADQTRRMLVAVKDDGSTDFRPVILGPIVDGLRVVRSGISPSDRVIISGLQRARPGGKVTPEAGTIDIESASSVAETKP
jgi:RND family efflux transporter MFP subunit